MSEQLCTRPVPRRCVSRVSLLCVCVCVFVCSCTCSCVGLMVTYIGTAYTCALTFSQSRLSLLSYPLCFSLGHWHIKSSSNGSFQKSSGNGSFDMAWTSASASTLPLSSLLLSSLLCFYNVVCTAGVTRCLSVSSFYHSASTLKHGYQ